MKRAERRRLKQKAANVHEGSFQASCGDMVFFITAISPTKPLWRRAFALLDRIPTCSSPAKCGAEAERIAGELGIKL